MLHDLILNTTDNEYLGLAKIDIVDDGKNLPAKMMNINDYTFADFPAGDAKKAAKELTQDKITGIVLEKEHLFSDVLAQFTSIGVLAKFNNVTLNPAPTTTTTTAG